MLWPILLVAQTMASVIMNAIPTEEQAKILSRGAPILGYDHGCSKYSKTCDWLARFPDKAKIVDLNLPGTHDAATWNYTAATREAFLNYTGPIPPAEIFRCQTRSLFQQLNDGIRVFDLRYSWNPDNQTIGFFHSVALLSPTTSLEDVFFGFYTWLTKHPTETVLISMKYESGPRRQNNYALQQKLYDIFNTDLAKSFWKQTPGQLGTLGEARGKLILLQRTPYNLLTPPLNEIGIPLPPSLWKDNGVNILIPYNPANTNTAHIEDYYNSPTSTVGLSANVDAKVNATLAHLQRAVSRSEETADENFWVTFASANQAEATPPLTPEMLALGQGDVQGVNQEIIGWLREHKGQRFGVIMMDFYEGVPGLIEAVLGL